VPRFLIRLRQVNLNYKYDGGKVVKIVVRKMVGVEEKVWKRL
jgi:hypothetical protein